VLLVSLHQQHQNVDGIVQSKRQTFVFYVLIKLYFIFSSRSPTPPSPRSPVSRSGSRSSIERGSKSPGVRKDTNQRTPSPPRQSSSSKRRRHKDGGDSGRHICAICSCDVEGAKRLYGLLDNCEHILYINSNFLIK